jgi:photosynthetic reaction center cytochrome c subunit
MKFGFRKIIRRATAAVVVCLCSAASAFAQTATDQKPLTAGQFFKNVKVLGGLPVNEFMTTMGFFSASLGYSCENCHGEDVGWENYAAEDKEKKQTARRMIAMVAGINKAYFAGRQVITCYSCHRGGNHPKMTPNLALLDSPPAEVEPDDVVEQGPKTPSVDQIFDKYIQAIGGAQRLANLTSFIAKGTSLGYGLEAEQRPVEIFAKAPGQRTTIVHSASGEDTTTYDGRAGWIAGPQIAGPGIPVPVLALNGGDLEGAKLDAELSFPGRIKQALGQWRVGRPTEIDDKEVQVVQGISSGGALATLYFDGQSGLLVRLMRYTNSTVGRFPTEIDFSDYREVSGVKMPFRWTVTWLDGRQKFELSEVQPNVPIDAAKFAKPASSAPPKPATP